MKERLEKMFEHRPKLTKIIGIVLVAIGFIALITPLTPGAWLIFLGLELLGVKLLLWRKIKRWF